MQVDRVLCLKWVELCQIHISLALRSWIVIIIAYLIAKWKLSSACDFPSRVLYMEWLCRKYVSPTYRLVCLAVKICVLLFARLGQYWHWQDGVRGWLALLLPPLMACFTCSTGLVCLVVIYLCVYQKKVRSLFIYLVAHIWNAKIVKARQKYNCNYRVLIVCIVFRIWNF
jgi:hypothetical protein